MFFCLFVTFSALAYRSHGLIFKYFVDAVELMATGGSARAMKFSARGHVGGWGLDFGVKNSPSEMHGKIFRPPNLGNGAYVLEQKGPNFRTETPVGSDYS